jgi:ABC-2 type transport system ATP-binding protein
MTLALDIRGFTKLYSHGLFGERTVTGLHNVSLQVDRGEIVAILGMNGAGKTTLIKCVLDLMRPTKGTSFLLGCPSEGRGWRGKVGYLPEIARFPVGMDPLEVLRLVGRVGGTRHHPARGRMAYWLERLSIPYDEGLYPARSKGLNRRLGLAAALLLDPEVLFLDEPSEGLDPVGARVVREIILESKSRNTAVILSSHILSEAEQVADRIVILKKGEAVITGPLQELVAGAGEQRIVVKGSEALGMSYIVRDSMEAGRLLEKLRREGAEVVAVLPVRATLQEVFERYAI